MEEATTTHAEVAAYICDLVMELVRMAENAGFDEVAG
jgi:hypothetical protein